MKIIITDYFRKNFLEKNEKYFSLDEFLLQIKEKGHKNIPLNELFIKQKLKINNVSFSGVIAFFKLKEIIIPLFLYLKKDKKRGGNISYPKDKNFIEEKFLLALDDFENELFEEYEI